MDLATISAIRSELERELTGRRFGKIFQLSKYDIAVDFRLAGSRYLFISIEPGNPRIYLIRRKLRELEKASGNPTNFSLYLRKKLSGSDVVSIEQIDGERSLIILFGPGEDDAEYSLAVQLTGRSANLLLLDPERRILETARETAGPGQQIGDVYSPPHREGAAPVGDEGVAIEPDGLSERLDEEDRLRIERKRFESAVASARHRLKQAISKREKLVSKLESDRSGHGDAVKWKHLGDVLLANSTTARRDGEKIWVTDYFAPDAPLIAVEAAENDSVTEAAEKYFKRYTKARNASEEIEKRLAAVGAELDDLNQRAQELEEAIESGDLESIESLAGVRKPVPGKRDESKQKEAPSGTRSFLSSDGFEILVGKKAKDNDFLTFRIAKSLDTWMHAADYPGSHVVIRNPNRKEIPQKTLLEAAQLAAFYSQGKKQPKAAVHYTQKKFVNKPRGAAPGLVSLASFKTLLVEPKVGAVTLK